MKDVIITITAPSDVNVIVNVQNPQPIVLNETKPAVVQKVFSAENSTSTQDCLTIEDNISLNNADEIVLGKDVISENKTENAQPVQSVVVAPVVQNKPKIRTGICVDGPQTFDYMCK